MTAIGFQLEKLFEQKKYVRSLRVYAYTAIVILGPTLLCIAMAASLNFLLVLSGISLKQRELFLAAAAYSYLFSLIITVGFSMIISRYISDKIYTNNYDEILPSLYGVITICLLIGGVTAGVFYYLSPLSIYFKFFAYTLFMELMVVWLVSVYIAAFKGYIRIVSSYLAGLITTSVCGYIFLYIFHIEGILGCIAAMAAGALLIILLLVLHIKRILPSKNSGYFMFFIYIVKYPGLFLVGLFYTTGLYIHNFIFRLSSFGETIGNTYVFCPFYDLPSFYALLTIVPAMAILIAAVESSFYGKYRNYYSVLETGTLDDITRARKEMCKVLKDEIKYMIGFQLFFSFIFMASGLRLLPGVGLMERQLHIFCILVLGNCSSIIMLFIMLLLLYFDDRKGALLISAMFLISNLVFTGLTMYMGEKFYGLGFFASSFITLIAAIYKLFTLLKNIDYYIFCYQPDNYNSYTS